MSRALRFFLWGVGVVVGLGAVLGALFGYFVYSPAPEVPRLSGKLTRGSIEVGGLRRTYLTYVPRGLAKGTPLVVVMHGSGENGARTRTRTGYGFERLADEHGFAVVYPDGYEGYWNACNIVGDYSANRLNIDDVGFLTGMIDKLITEIGIDRARVFAIGISRGGHMAFRLALEAPSRFRAVAAVSASVPTPENFKCRPVGQGTSSVMIMNGTKDPLNPFNGGEVKLFGLFGRGYVRSSRASGQYLADLNHIAGTPEASETEVADGVRVERVLWRNNSNVEVELEAIHGGGHGIPQPYTRLPRLLGPTSREPNGPAVIWAFFERQRPGPLSSPMAGHAQVLGTSGFHHRPCQWPCRAEKESHHV
jgi:polyhydroxybutyrate depolymerase